MVSLPQMLWLTIVYKEAYGFAIVPVGLAASIVKKGVTGSHIGMAKAEV